MQIEKNWKQKIPQSGDAAAKQIRMSCERETVKCALASIWQVRVRARCKIYRQSQSAIRYGCIIIYCSNQAINGLMHDIDGECIFVVVAFGYITLHQPTQSSLESTMTAILDWK